MQIRKKFVPNKVAVPYQKWCNVMVPQKFVSRAEMKRREVAWDFLLELLRSCLYLKSSAEEKIKIQFFVNKTGNFWAFSKIKKTKESLLNGDLNVIFRFFDFWFFLHKIWAQSCPRFPAATLSSILRYKKSEIEKSEYAIQIPIQ